MKNKYKILFYLVLFLFIGSVTLLVRNYSYAIDDNTSTIYTRDELNELFNDQISALSTLDGLINNNTIISLYVNNESTNIIPSNGNYYLDDSISKCFNNLGTVEDNNIEYDNDKQEISISNNDKPLFCKVYLLSGRKVNVLVSNGILVDGFVLENIIENGNFEKDLTYWTHYDPNYVTSDSSSGIYTGTGGLKSMKNTGTALPQQGLLRYGGIREDIYESIFIKSNSKYYVSFFSKNTSTICHAINHFIMSNTSFGILVPPNTISWAKSSGIADSGKERIPGRDYIAIGWFSTSDCGGTIWMDDTMLINLTEAFGRVSDDEYQTYKTIVNQMPYFEPFGSVATDIKPTNSLVYEVWPYKTTSTYLYSTPTVVSGNCSINGNTITVPPGNDDVTCIIRYS